MMLGERKITYKTHFKNAALWGAASAFCAVAGYSFGLYVYTALPAAVSLGTGIKSGWHVAKGIKYKKRNIYRIERFGI